MLNIRKRFLLHHFLFFFLTHVNSQLQVQEESTLLKLKQHWQNPPSLSHWKSSSSASHCTWPEVNCADGSVIELHLGGKDITGTIPSFITDLKNLTVLDFYNNNIGGTFPVSLYDLSKLEYLDLSENYFVGFLPEDIDRMSKLSTLNLGGNNFTGDIPAAVGRLTGLRSLQLRANLFNGTFPPEFGNLSDLEILMLAHNQFKPSELFNLTRLKKLKHLWISNANLIGEFPGAIGEMADLEFLDLSSNSLTGNISENLFLLKNLSQLLLHKNHLSGSIPQVVEALNLKVIDLSDNNLTGPIPDDFGKLEKLTGLALFFNQLSGEIPESLGRLPALIDFGLFSNKLSGPIPPDFGLYSKLETFQVSSNRLSGKLPEHLCNGSKLVGLVVFDNNLSGELPQSLGNCDSLGTVMLQNNAFSGNVPAGMWKALNLSSLQLNNNKFTGELPDEVAGNLSRIEISYNNFSGGIPSGMSSWRNLVVFSASNNLFTGTIPWELTALPLLTTLLLDRNQLSGPLPADIISWARLTSLNLSGNQLSGQIPEGIGNLPVLSALDLSDNDFSGQIPSGNGFRQLTSLNLSSNQLTGKIPNEFENGAYADSFLSNPGLCSSSSLVNLKSCNYIPRKSSKGSTRLLALILSALASVFLLAMLLSFFIIRNHGKRRNKSDETWTLKSFHKLNFTETDILSGLTENNLVGSGGSGKVYRVATNNSGSVVAVKKICSKKKLYQTLDKEFLAEMEILSTIRHLNIVKLLCCIFDDNSKLLVYEYLENQSLDRWLHRKRTATAASGTIHHVILDWPKRLHIAEGAAQGLSYMHHEFLPPIVHRDIKSSNILLDSEFNAKIADFGLARMMEKPEELATMSGIYGSFGYMAPEYTHKGKVNEKSDVYSFGVVLLELTTGKEAHNGDENTSLADWSWRHVQEGKPIIDALDRDVMEPGNLEEMSSVFKLGVLCTSKLPSARPSTKEVLKILQRNTKPLVFGEKDTERDYDATPLLKNSKRERASESPENGFTSNV
ncbi:hypothetical protein K2173_015916 [Erythroxylum novogranatense]|uniref:non-specific serine/threonine protein kinase n=1 Tax=Erythroxylum novogranatense TaxID=1862640 RepID=A0AAV8SFN3_9ROSI|nr:hypothetical protein K2173_015916 [Erythroxylum novogranatense]